MIPADAESSTHRSSECSYTSPDEVEVTPEMIKAGALELSRFNSNYQSLEDGAERIFLAMEMAHQKRS